MTPCGWRRPRDVNDIEDALIRRIDARQAIAAALADKGGRDRGIISGYWRDDLSGTEIARKYGVSRSRVHQIADKFLQRARQAIAAPPHPPRRDIEARFDRAAFLRHMRGLIERRQNAEAREFEQNCSALQSMLARERKRAAPTPTPAAQPKWFPHPHDLPAWKPYSPPFVPAPPLDVAELAKRALVIFTRVRFPFATGWLPDDGSQTVGERCSVVRFRLMGPVSDQVLEDSLMRLSNEIPAAAILSAKPLAAALPMGGNASNRYVSVQTLATDFNPWTGEAGYRFAVTWDYPPPNA
jgi:hypothetical protein